MLSGFLCVSKNVSQWAENIFLSWALWMLCLGLGKTFLEWWEASRKSFTEKLKACRVKLNTSLVPFTLQTMTNATDSHSFFHALRWIMFTLNQTTPSSCACLPPILYHSESPRCTNSGWKTHYLTDPSEKQAKTVRNNFPTRQTHPKNHSISGPATVMAAPWVKLPERGWGIKSLQKPFAAGQLDCSTIFSQDNDLAFGVFLHHLIS